MTNEVGKGAEAMQTLHSEVGKVEGDESIPFESWAAYEAAVKAEKIEAPEVVKVAKRPKYEFNVDQALDCIDLSFGGYVPSQDAIEFFNIIRLVLGEDPEVENSLMHYFLVDLVFGNIEREQYPYSKEIRDKIRINKNKIAIIAARMSAKSTILTAYLPIYLAIKGSMPNFGSVMFVVGFGDSQQAGAKVQANTIRDFCSDSEFCKEYFEKMRFTDEECEFTRCGKGSIKSRSFMYKVKGAAGGSVRGIRYRTERPSIFLFDDIIKNEAEAGSKVIMTKLRSMIYSDAENALGVKGKIIAINTPFNKNDPIYSALESGIWTPICLPLAEKIRIGMTRKQYRGAWPQMHSFERIMERYEDAYYGGTLREFNQELMLRISSDEDRLISDGSIQWISRKPIMKMLGNFTVLITTDFTASDTKVGDFSGAAVWAISSTDEWFLIDLVLKKMTIKEQYSSLFGLVNRWSRNGRILEVGVELDGQQRLNLFALKNLMIEKNIWFRFAQQKGAPNGREGITSRATGGNKLERFKYTLPQWDGKKVWFAEELRDTPDMVEMLEELKYVTSSGIGSKHDDGIDLISQVNMISYVVPSEGVSVEEEEKVVGQFEDVWGDVEDDEVDSGGSTVF